MKWSTWCAVSAIAVVFVPGVAGASDSALPARSQLHPVRTTAPDGSSLQLGFAGQLRATITNTGERLDDDDRETDESVELRRVRLLLKGALLDDRLGFRLQISLHPASPELMDLWTDYAFSNPVRLRLGQFKVPFTRYRRQSFGKLLLADWPIAASQFGGERQLGLMLHNGQDDETPWSYELGLFTGNNARASFATGVAEAHGERLESPSNLRTPGGPVRVHPEVVARVSHNAPGIGADSNSDASGGGLRHSVGLSAAWDFAAVASQEFSERFAAEALLKCEHVSLNLVGYAGVFRPDQGLAELASLGATAELAWRFVPELELAGRYSRVELTRELRRSARRRADRVIAEASPNGPEDLAQQYAHVGTTHAQEEYGMGLNWYWAGNKLKWQNDVAWLRRISPSRPSEDVRFRSQVQLVF